VNTYKSDGLPMRGALAVLALLSTPAAATADKVFFCEGGTIMSTRHGGREVVIKRIGEMAISMPRAGTVADFTWWVPTRALSGCSTAPCAFNWHIKGKPEKAYFMLEPSQKVKCRLK